MPPKDKKSIISSIKSLVNRAKPTLLLVLVTTSLSLAACGTTQGLFSPDDLYPQSLMSCAPEPAVPPRPISTSGVPVPRPESEKAGYIKDLRGAGQDCRDDVGAIAERKALYKAQYEKENFGAGERLWRGLTGKSKK